MYVCAQVDLLLGEAELFAAGFDGSSEGELEGRRGRHTASLPGDAIRVDDIGVDIGADNALRSRHDIPVEAGLGAGGATGHRSFDPVGCGRMQEVASAMRAINLARATLAVILGCLTIGGVMAGSAAGVTSPETAPAPYTAPDGTEVSIGTAATVINEDDIELPVRCLASPSGSCVFVGNGGLYNGAGLLPSEPLEFTSNEDNLVAYGGGSPYPLYHPGIGVNLYPLVVPVGGSGTTWYWLSERNRLGYQRFLRLGSVVVGAVVCAHAPCVATRVVDANPDIPPTTETNGAPPVDVGSIALDLSYAEPPPPTYVHLSHLTVRPDGEATITMRCTSSHLLRGDCIVTDLEAEAPGGRDPNQRWGRWLFVRRRVVLKRGAEKTVRLYYWQTGQAAGSPTPSSFQRGIWSEATQAFIGTAICDSRRHGCHASPFNAYGNSEITAELIQLGPPELPAHMLVAHG